jgi:hypothetical protein
MQTFYLSCCKLTDLLLQTPPPPSSACRICVFLTHATLESMGEEGGRGRRERCQHMLDASQAHSTSMHICDCSIARQPNCVIGDSMAVRSQQ